MRITSFEYFRGIAILFIVAGHSYSNWYINSFHEKVIANLISGGTVLFVFISGFFFHHVFYNRFVYRNYFIKRSSHVFIPYCILSLAGFSYFILTKTPLPMAEALGIKAIPPEHEYLQILTVYFWTGRIAVSYWFIPFIILIFLAAPLFYRFVKLPTAVQYTLIGFFLIVSMLIHRPTFNLSPVHSFIYFIPVYLIGIISSIKKDQVFKFIETKARLLALMVLAMATFQAAFYEKWGNFVKADMFAYAGLDIMIVQKLLMCFFWVALLKKFENSNFQIIELLASASFAIFFLHPWIYMALDKCFISKGLLDAFPGGVTFLSVAPLVVSLTLLLAVAIKSLFKQKSRLLIGW